MKHPGRVRDYLEHIAAAIERATRYAKNAGTLEDLERNEQAQDAIVRTTTISMWRGISSGIRSKTICPRY
jgi:uncharacterized protein with HEPN domain